MIPDLNSIEKKIAGMETGKDKVMPASKELIRSAGKAIALMHADGPKASARILPI